MADTVLLFVAILVWLLAGFLIVTKKVTQDEIDEMLASSEMWP